MAGSRTICFAFFTFPYVTSFIPRHIFRNPTIHTPLRNQLSVESHLTLLPSLPIALPQRPSSPHTLLAATTTAKASDVEERELTLGDVKGSNEDAAWSDIPEDLYFIANYAASLGGDYPPENVDKSYWDQVSQGTYEKLAALAKTADPTTISQAQYIILMEATVRSAIAKDPKLERPKIPEPDLSEQQEFVYNWVNSIDNADFVKFKEEYKLDDMSPEEWWNKIDEIAADNERKGLKVPEMTLDLTNDDFLGVARDEFVKSIKQFLAVEAELYPVFIITMPGCEEGAKLVDLFNKTLDIPVRTYEVFGFDTFKFKVKAEYDWAEARLDAIQEMTGTKELPLVYVAGELIGGPEQVNSKMSQIKQTVQKSRQELVDMVQQRYPTDEEESNYIGMRRVSAAEYKAFEANQAKDSDPLQAKRSQVQQQQQGQGQQK